MYQMLLNLWIAGSLTESKLDGAVTKGYITPAQRDMIAATPRLNAQ